MKIKDEALKWDSFNCKIKPLNWGEKWKVCVGFNGIEGVGWAETFDKAYIKAIHRIALWENDRV